MSVSHLVWKTCDCLPKSCSKKPREVLLRDDTDMSAHQTRAGSDLPFARFRLKTFLILII